MRRRLALLAFLGLVAWLGASGLGNAATAAPVGGTSASVQGETVTITVRFDLCCTQSAAEETVYGPLIREEVTQAQAIWNTALAKLPVAGCVKLRVAFDVHLLREGPAPADKGYHVIEINFTKEAMSFSMDVLASTPYDDTTTVYTQPVSGEFYDAGLPVVEWAHELGHLMGLGDDYYHRGTPGHTYAEPLPGRADTMMADKGPHTIDQNLADRLADIANRAGAKLPGCPWTGTIESDTQRVYVYSDGGTAQCNDHWHGDISFTVKPDGTALGTGKLMRTSGPACSGRIDTGAFSLYPPAKQVDISVSGSKQRDGFTLELGFVSIDGVDYGGMSSLYVNQSNIPPGPPLTIPSTGPCTASGNVATSRTIISDTVTASNVLALKCKTS